MNKDLDQVTERILDLTLEIISLLTGEDYVIVKKSGERVSFGRSSRGLGGCHATQIPGSEFPALSQLHEKNMDKKILELIDKIIHLLTGVDWPDLEETKKPFGDVVMESHHLFISLDGSVSRGPPDGRHITVLPPTPEIKQKTEHKETLGGCRISENTGEGSASSAPGYTPTERNVKEEPASRVEGAPADTEDPSPIQFREEPATREKAGPTDVDVNTQRRHPSPRFLEEEVNLVGRRSSPSTDRREVNPGELRTSRLRKKSEKDEEPDQKRKRLTCFDCGKEFAYKSMLVIHERVHTEERPYPCPECGKCFSRKSHLVTHQKIHTGEKEYSCSECGKGFNQEANLVAHQRIHTGEKPFCCPDCGRRFSRKIYLSTHQRTHTGEKPFLCSECGKSFSQKSALNTHQRTHSTEKPCSCPECGKSFSQKSYLNTHRRVHAEEKPSSCSE